MPDLLFEPVFVTLISKDVWCGPNNSDKIQPDAFDFQMTISGFTGWLVAARDNNLECNILISSSCIIKSCLAQIKKNLKQVFLQGKSSCCHAAAVGKTVDCIVISQIWCDPKLYKLLPQPTTPGTVDHSSQPCEGGNTKKHYARCLEYILYTFY